MSNKKLKGEKDSNLTLEFLRQNLEYNSSTGDFVWKINKRGLAKGSIAGSKNDQGYIMISLNLYRYRAHRLAHFYMTGSWPDEEVDHIDGNRSNNAWSNLRCVSRSENKKNVGKCLNNTSGVNGVMWYKAGQKWHAQITINRKKIHLGYFDTIEEAQAARKQAEVSYGFHDLHGEKLSYTLQQNSKETT